MVRWRPTGKRRRVAKESVTSSGPGARGPGPDPERAERATDALEDATRGVTMRRELAYPLPQAAARPSWPGSGTPGLPGRGPAGDGRAGRTGAEPAGHSPANPVPSQRRGAAAGPGDVHVAASGPRRLAEPDDKPDDPASRLSHAGLAPPAQDDWDRAHAAAAGARRGGQRGPAGSGIQSRCCGAWRWPLAAITLVPRRADRGAGARPRAGYVRFFATRARRRASCSPSCPPPGRAEHAARRTEPGYLGALLHARGLAERRPAAEPSAAARRAWLSR